MPPLRILHVDDDPDDAFFLLRAIRNARPDCELHLENKGETAVDYLRNAADGNESGAHPAPDLMILDLKLHGLSGFEILAWTRSQAALKTLPIIVLSGSSLAEDRKKASDLGASEFIVKHSDYDQIAQEIIRFISKIGVAV
jgi:DNA-binding response OmpR family regulator